MNKFKHYPIRPQKLTADFVKKEYAKLLTALPRAEKADQPDLWLELFTNLNALKSYIGTQGARGYYQYSKNMNNQPAEATEKYFREKIGPACEKPEFTL